MSRSFLTALRAGAWLGLTLAAGGLTGGCAGLFDRRPPEVTIVAPAAGDTLSATRTVTVRASDRGGLRALALSVDGTEVVSRELPRKPRLRRTSAAFRLDTGPLADGRRRLVASARDRAGNVAEVAIEVEVANPTAPAVSRMSRTAAGRGGLLTLEGAGFDPEDVEVFFPFGRRARVVDATTTAVTVEVPGGARSGRPAVRSAGRTLRAGAVFQPLRARVAPAKPPRGVTIPRRGVLPTVRMKLRQGCAVRLRDGIFVSLGGDDLGPLFGVLDRFTIRGIARASGRSESALAAERETIETRRGREVGDLNLYFLLDVATATEAVALADALNELALVERAVPLADPEGRLETGDILPRPSCSFVDLQDYRRNYRPPEGTFGVGADFVNALPGGDGAGIRIGDVETSWIRTHEDFDGFPALDLQPGTPGAAQVDEVRFAGEVEGAGYHGLSVLGILIADDDPATVANNCGVDPRAPGVRGLASGADGIFLSPHNRDIGRAIERLYAGDPSIGLSAPLRPGDILLLEVGTLDFGCFAGEGLPPANGLPAECAPFVFDLIERATEAGVVVIEPAGNGRNPDSVGDGGGLSPRVINCTGAGGLQRLGGGNVGGIGDFGTGIDVPAPVVDSCGEAGQVESDRRGFDLDDPAFRACFVAGGGVPRPCFDRAVRDSGAIFVGAGFASEEAGGSERLAYSNFGSIVDVHAKGAEVTTAGCLFGHHLGFTQPPSCVGEVNFAIDPSEVRNQVYYFVFDGTSAASAIVAGGVAALQGLHLATTGATLGPFEMRELLRRTGQPQIAAGEDGSIGAHLDLEAAAIAGVLTPATVIYEPPGVHNFNHLAAADFDGDGRSELVVTSATGQADAVHVLNGDAESGFSVRRSSPGPGFASSSHPVFLVAGGDPPAQLLGLAVALQQGVGDGAIDLLASGQDFTFAGAGPLAGAAVGGNLDALAVLDAGGPTLPPLDDPVTDLAWLAGGELRLLRGRADGSHDLADAVTLPEPAGTALPFVRADQLLAADFSGDGRADLVVGASGVEPVTDTRVGTVRIFRGLAGGAFAAGDTVFTSPQLRIRDLAAGDVDGDGVLDLVFAADAGLLGAGTGTVSVVFGPVEAGAAPVTHVASGGCCEVSSVTLGDVDDDGRLDLVANNRGGEPGIAVLFNRGRPSPGAALDFSPQVVSRAPARSPLVVQIDSDPRPEILFLQQDTVSAIDIVRIIAP